MGCSKKIEVKLIFSKGNIEMPNPKRKFSKTRRDKRRTHYKAVPAQTCPCPNCGAAKLNHMACPECGYYNGRKVIAAL